MIDNKIIANNCLIAGWLVFFLDLIWLAGISLKGPQAANYLFLLIFTTILFVLFVIFICKINSIINHFRKDTNENYTND